MFFGNSDLLERNLHNDLNNLIKNVRLREDQHFAILQYNKNLISQQKQLDSIAFLQEEIAKHKNFFNSVTQAHNQIKQEEAQMLEKYSYVTSAQQSIVKLIGRVISRVAETCQASAQKIQFYDQAILKKQSQMKSVMMKLMNEKPNIDIFVIIETMILYVSGKVSEEMAKLKQIIIILEEGNIQKLDSVYVPLKKVHLSSSAISIDKREFKKSLQRAKEREKLQKFREEARNAEAFKKKKTKLANKMYNGLYSTMELSKQQFMEDMVFAKAEEKKKKLYEQIFSRNKFNREQILYFQSKKTSYLHKIKQFKEMMEAQSKKFDKILSKEEDIPDEEKLQTEEVEPIIDRAKTDVKSEPIEGENYGQIILPEEDKLQHDKKSQKKLNFKITSPKLLKQAAFSSMQSTQEGFQHIKFDLKNEEVFSRTNRAKLPLISGRSVDNRYEQRKPVLKEQKKISIIKNIEIGSFTTASKKNSVHKNEKKSSPKNEKQANEGIGGLLEYTFYVRKKTNKFYDPKNNYLF